MVDNDNYPSTPCLSCRSYSAVSKLPLDSAMSPSLIGSPSLLANPLGLSRPCRPAPSGSIVDLPAFIAADSNAFPRAAWAGVGSAQRPMAVPFG